MREWGDQRVRHAMRCTAPWHRPLFEEEKEIAGFDTVPLLCIHVKEFCGGPNQLKSGGDGLAALFLSETVTILHPRMHDLRRRFATGQEGMNKVVDN
jgi:hypothetical protein